MNKIKSNNSDTISGISSFSNSHNPIKTSSVNTTSFVHCSYDFKKSMIDENFGIIDSKASDLIIKNQEVKQLLEETFKIMCSKNYFWKASLESVEDQDFDDTDYYKLRIFIGEKFIKDRDNRLSLLSYKSISVYDEILNKLMEKSDETFKKVILDESFI